jgi:hypothetical protein
MNDVRRREPPLRERPTTTIEEYAPTAPRPPADIRYPSGPPPAVRGFDHLLTSPKLASTRIPRAPDPPTLDLADAYVDHKSPAEREKRRSVDFRRADGRRRKRETLYPQRHERDRHDNETRDQRREGEPQHHDVSAPGGSSASDSDSRQKIASRRKSTQRRPATSGNLGLKDVQNLRNLKEELAGKPSDLPRLPPRPPSALTTLAEVSPAFPPSSTLPEVDDPESTPFLRTSLRSAEEQDQQEQPSKSLVRFSAELDRTVTPSTPPQITFQHEVHKTAPEDPRSDVKSLVDELRDKTTLLQSIISPGSSRRGLSPSNKAHRLSTGPAMGDPSIIIYRLSCRDLLTQEELLRYSTTPFEGFIESHGDTRTEYAPMDVMLYIQGNKLKDRKSQHRSTFGTNRDPDPDPFVVGEDFFARVIEPTYIRILSPQIQKVLRKLVLYYPGHDLQGKEFLFKEPYRILVHYHTDLQKVAEAYNSEDKTLVLGNDADEPLTTVTCDETTHNHLSILLNSPTYKDHYDRVIEPELRNYANGYASYDMLWLLFKPGDTVLARVRKDLAGFIVLAADHTQDPCGVSPLDRWTIQVWNLAYTGRCLTRQAHEFTIDRYDGLRKIDRLNIFPKRFLKYYDDKVEEELIARGTEYFKIVCGSPAHRRYSGSVIANHLVQVR